MAVYFNDFDEPDHPVTTSAGVDGDADAIDGGPRGSGFIELAHASCISSAHRTAFIGPSSEKKCRQGAEQADELVADELVDRPFVLEQDVDHDLEVLVQHGER